MAGLDVTERASTIGWLQTARGLRRDGQITLETEQQQVQVKHSSPASPGRASGRASKWVPEMVGELLSVTGQTNKHTMTLSILEFP
ncbi:hypothetical protein RRG08_025981 [Elysia crispata]|uniref:Uncharacterized protein n=1 Tax=Elysia crispata TaxID=231223 RepID=A0AAE0ZG86_9GAST|nr:hypothetical protein RRG08_025981 [Elysia crispata]